MFWYLIVFAILFALAIVEAQQTRAAGIIAGILLALMAGLRYETGFDWADYETSYWLTPGFGQSDIYASITTILVEPGFEFLNRILRTLGADFQVLLFLSGSLSIFGLVFLSARFSPLIGVILLWYYGFLFLPGPLATMRQTLSVTFIYFSLIKQNERKTSWSLLWCAVALSLHYFSAIFIPVIFWRWFHPNFRWSVIFAAIGFAISTIGNNLFVLITDLVVSATGAGFVADKMQIYSSFAGASISPFSLALVAYHLGFIWLVERKKPEDEFIVKAALVSSFMIIVLHSLFAPFPILWNRMMLVTFPLEAIVLCRLYVSDLARPTFRVAVVFLAGLGSLLSLVYTLSNPQSLVYKPYQNVAVVLVRGPYGTGHLRYQVVRNDANIAFREQKVR